MANRRWYRIDRRGADSESIVEALTRATSLVSTEVFAIRNPELRVLGRPGMANRHYDGRTVRGDEALHLVDCLLNDSGFWCELESNDLDVHVSEEAIYLGISPEKASSMRIPTDLDVAAVADSPYAQHDAEVVPYRPATAEFWKDLDALLERLGSLLLLSQWAGGLGGEQWYLLQKVADAAVVRSEGAPRSILAAFDPACYISIGDSGPAEIERFVGPDPHYGDLRWLTPDSGPRLEVSVVSDEQDLHEKCKAPAVGAVLFCWPEEDLDIPVMAAWPDDDGVVRTSFRFE